MNLEEEEEEKTDLPEEEDEWLDVLGTGDLKKKVVKPGITESRPYKGTTVVIKAQGCLENGKEADIHNQLTFTVGDGEVIMGLDMIAPLMDKGEIAEVYIAARFAFGSKGLPPNIPPESNLNYRVELIDYSPEEDPGSLPIEKRMVIGNRKRERGNWWFNREEYSLAIQCYNAAIDFLDDAEEEYGEDVKPEVNAILSERLKALNNMGAAQMKVGAYEVALKSLEAVLKCQPNNIKALFRKGKVLGLQGKVKDSMKFLKRALELEPESRLIHHELAKMKEQAREEAESEKSLYRRMLNLKKTTPTQGEKRYPVIKSFPWKTWVASFLVMLCLTTAGTQLYGYWK
ncbi:hypothetical protein Pcinc_037422 [Petrolisthes cinctipes]|uniref:peptidylprolyl isomerase n=1 Tax=Petrolisthes cinctipes TaxID=88211 RepID=A0AAE1BSU0_PETCI|nr:hypothetical protein Pcinc_037422 [Petrolisthes cinctipes]